MIEGILQAGRAYLSSGHSFLESQVRGVEPRDRQGRQRYIAVLDLHTQGGGPRLDVDAWEIDDDRVARVLWVGNVSANSDQVFLTSDKTHYLVSQSVPNLLERLPDGDLAGKLRRLLDAVYLDLGEKHDVFGDARGDQAYGRYRRLWDLAALGVADPELLSGRDRTETEQIAEESGAPAMGPGFLRAYAAQRGKAADAAALAGRLLEAWTRRKLGGLRGDQLALYTLRLDGQLLADHPDYHRYLEGYYLGDLFQDAHPGRCHLCGMEAPVTADTTRFDLLKFYITDKPGFASGIHERGFLRSYALCYPCYRALLAGERFVDGHLRTRIARDQVYVVPEFHLPADQPPARRVEAWAGYLKERLAATQTIDAWREFQQNIQDYYEEFERLKGSFVLNFLFVERSNSAVKVRRLIQDVPPSRLDCLHEARRRTHDFADRHFGEGRQWDLGLGRLFYLFPIRWKDRRRNQAQTEPFLEFLDALLAGRPVFFQRLVPQLLETARVHRFEHYENPYVHGRPPDVDPALTAFLVQAQLLLRYLRDLDQLKGLPTGGEMMEAEQTMLPAEMRDYLAGLDLPQAQRGLFLLGYLVGEVASEQWSRGRSKPVLNKIGFQGMDRNKVARLANVIYDDLRNYRIARYHEGVYAAMKALLDHALLDRTGSGMDSAQENTYWLLSGYAYATQQRLAHGGDDTAGDEEPAPGEPPHDEESN